MPKVSKERVPLQVTNSNRRKQKPTKRKVAGKSCTLHNGVKWDVTAEILEDMGVATLDDVSYDKIFKEEPTPESRAPDCLSAPKIPKCGTVPALADRSSPDSPSFSSRFAMIRKHKFDESVGEDPFVKLSDEIILHIFKWLPKSTLSKCVLVSKRWKSLSYDETLWRRVDLSKKYMEAGVLGIVVERGVVVLRLAMSNILGPISVGSVHLNKEMEGNQRFSKLQFLDLSMACISPGTLSDLVSVCSHLKKISLERCELNDDICGHLGENPNMEVINMSMCSGLNPGGIYSIASNCLRLQSWNLGWTNLSVESMNVLSQSMPSSLKKFNISGHREVLNDNHVAKLIERCPNLIELDISDSTQLTSTSMEVIIHSLSELEALHSSRCYSISLESYFELACIASLRCLTAYGMMNENLLEGVKQKLPNVDVNKELFSTVSRPTVGVRRTSIWGLRVRD